MGCYDRRMNRRTGEANVKRRGSILILVVGVLVLLAISATLYVGVGRQERLSSSAQESSAIQSEVINKIVEFLGQTLTDDLYSVNPKRGKAVRPFEDGQEIRDDMVAGERWDYPSTQPGADSTNFGVLADPWLASTEPADIKGGGNGSTLDGIPDTWVHLSNVNRQGLFVDLNELVNENLVRRFSIYGNVTIGGNQPPDPFDLDTLVVGGVPNTAHSSNPFLDYSKQLDEIEPNDGINGIPTYADQRYGTDTDGDGRIDARWTELPDVYGLPQGMRVFAAFRVVDLSSMVNINTSIETGPTQNDDERENVGFPRYPSDIDLYTMLLDEYGRLGQLNGLQPLERFFAGGDPQTGVNGAYRENLSRLGVLGYAANYLQNQDALNYDFFMRLKASDRATAYRTFMADPQMPFDDFRPYGPDDELELRTYWGMSNDLYTSRLESNFEVLNGNRFDPKTWLSPFRNRYPYEVDYSNSGPSVDENVAITGIRNKVTTINGSVPVSPWNVSEEDTTIRTKTNINDLLTPADENTNVDLQPVFSGTAWALLPFSVRHAKDRNGNYLDTNIYGKPAEWVPSGPLKNSTYGGGPADFAYLRAAMLAVNLLDYFDPQDAGDPKKASNDPTVRILRFEQEDVKDANNPTGRDPETELAGIFPWGEIDDDGLNQNPGEKNLMLIGLEQQPFFREAAHVQVWNAHRLPNEQKTWEIIPSLDDPPDGIPDDLVFEIVAVEIGNPWSGDIDLSEYEIVLGDKNQTDQKMDLSFLGIPILEAGKTVVIARWAADRNLGPIGGQMRNDWRDLIEGAGGPDRDVRFIEGGDVFVVPEMADDELTLWRKDVELKPGSVISRVMVDRLNAKQSGTGDEDRFPGKLVRDWQYVDQTEDGSKPGFQLVFNTSMRRNVARPVGVDGANGFPPYVMQSRNEIGLHGIRFSQAQIRGQGELDPLATIFSTNAQNMVDEFNTPDADDKKYPAGFADSFSRPFQLHVLNSEDVASPFDLLNVTAISHVYVPANGDITVFNPLVDPIDQGKLNRDRYVTISEMLGDEQLSSELANRISKSFINRVLHPAGNSRVEPPDLRILPDGARNHFVGKLDYTRYIPWQSSLTSIPQGVPLAVRVVDAFDTVTPLTPTGLVQGRININTASTRVLQSLPFLHPRFKAGEIPARTPGIRFAKAIQAYRDRDTIRNPVGINWSNRAEASRLIEPDMKHGLRQDVTKDRGITSLGELALITQWSEVGTNDISHEPNRLNPLIFNQTLVQAGISGTNFTYVPLNPDLLATDRTPENDPADDVTEWLIMPRAISNVISLRSDVYCAYIKVIGFTPADVNEAIQKELDGTVDDALAALKPTMEQRYVVVFDRSNVKQPGDRPRLLFAVQPVPTR